MKRIIIIFFIALGILSCAHNSEIKKSQKTGKYSGIISYGNFSDRILVEIEQDSTNFYVYFSSLEQNANRIPLQGIEVNGDSISFRLQSDFYTYLFKNKWSENNSKLQGSLTVDTVIVPYVFEKEKAKSTQKQTSEDVIFESNGLKINGTIWHPENNENKALVILTSSGSADRSASRSEAILFAQKGFTTFHYDKRGTGNSDGDWETASIEELSLDDINAINYFSDKTGISHQKIGILGSSQGAAKIPLVLNELEDIQYGILVSCPGVSLLESDLNYWKNRNEELFGNEVEDAVKLERKVFEFIGGRLTRSDLEASINENKTQPWFEHIWIPNLEEVRTDKKLLYSPLPHLESTKQPLLIIQGQMDEIIPANSYTLISDALKKSGNNKFKTVLLEGASHSMHKVEASDFPYWHKLHPDYLSTIDDWINSILTNEHTESM